MQFERHETESTIVARVNELRAKGFEIDCTVELNGVGYSPVILADNGDEFVRIAFNMMQAPIAFKRTEARAMAETIASKTDLTAESAIAYVENTFADSFDKVIDCELIEDCGLVIAIVRVQCGNVICRADVWRDVESAKLYGEL